MEEDKKKEKKIKLIIYILIFFAILIMALYYFQEKRKNSQTDNNTVTEEQEEQKLNEEATLEYNFNTVTDEMEFINVEKGVSNYFKLCSEKNSNDILLLLNQDYITQNGINNENVLNKIKRYDGYNTFFADTIYFQVDDLSNENETYYMTYYVKGTVWGNSFKDKNEVYIVLKEDTENMNYTIIPQDDVNLEEKSFDEIISEKQKEFMEKYKSGVINIDDDLEYDDVDDYDDTNQNTEEDESEATQEEAVAGFIMPEVNDKDSINRYINKIVIECLYGDSNYAYDLIYDECKVNKFKENKQEFINYINNNKDKLYNMNISEINVGETDDEFDIKYGFKDVDGNVYYLYVVEAEDFYFSIK